eukprot:GGOE01013188.1.p1 GENE.GGOE01013188.1~~GGOE01013188.1.p1  ORF type:complete len:1065 (-),score=374.02 GGOE01013188.1:644-3526(-)
MGSPITPMTPVPPLWNLPQPMEEPRQPAACSSTSERGRSMSPRESDGKCCITVAVRVRPFAKSESADARAPVLMVDGRKVTVRDPNSKSKSIPPHQFSFDEVLWSASTPEASAKPPASQQDVYEALGYPLLQNLIRGYNACLLCYGQTGSGKTYTMSGTPTEPGIMPRYAEAVFQCLEDQQKVNKISAYRVQVAFMEIYNEKVFDLLVGKSPRSAHKNLRVRQHPVRGSFVEGLTQHAVQSGAAILKLMRQGNEQRATAATRMNDRSSRSHAVVTIEVSQQAVISQTDSEDLFSSKTSCVHLVDLAGSERVDKSEIEFGARFQELTSINQSLSTLSRVIEALSDPSGSGKRPPYRESLLTWLLVDSFGGNSKTTMIATVSPAASDASETLSTLRYASRARKIVNKAVINEDPSLALIGALQAETQLLRVQLAELTEKNTMLMESKLNVEEVDRLRNKLCFSEKLIEELKEHSENERLAWEMQFQRLSLKHEMHEAKQLEVQRSCEATEKQLDKARAEVRRKGEEVAALHQALAEKEEEVAAKADRQQQLQEEICAKEEEIHQRETQLQTIRDDRERLEARNAEMLAEIRREVALREAEFKERLRWEQRAKAMEQRLQEEIAQRQERIVAEQTLLEVLRGEREAIIQMDSRVASSHEELMVTVGRLQEEQHHLQAMLVASEQRLDGERALWAAEVERLRRREQALVAEVKELVEKIRDAERCVAQADQHITATTTKEAETQTDALSPEGYSPLALHEVMEMLEVQERHISDVNWDAVSEQEKGHNRATVQQILGGTSEDCSLLSSDHFVHTLVEEFTKLLQSSVENRKEWRELYDSLTLTMQAVSGKPRFSWFSTGPKTDSELQQALERQEALNSRAAGWLMGLQTQREVLKQNVGVQLRINQRLALERTSLQQERDQLQVDLQDASGRFERAMEVIRRVHRENDCLRSTAPAEDQSPLTA